MWSDILTGFASDAAERGCIAVYLVLVRGWWKEIKKRDRSEHGGRYALVGSPGRDEADTDIWTPIANLVGLEVPIDVQVQEASTLKPALT